MRLGDLIEGLPHRSFSGNKEVDVKAIHYDSRSVSHGSLFVAIPGRRYDGHNFIPQALKNGAVALVAEREMEIETPHVPIVLVDDSRKALAHISSNFYNYPSRKLQVIGITGTNGKTTTTYLLESILKCAGQKAGVIGTINYRMESIAFPALHTTPEASDLQGLLALMVEKGISHAVIEVSSHSLAMHRVRGCEFDAAVFTNFSQDHLDFHGSTEDYFQAKSLLFSTLGMDSFKEGPKWAILNSDDPYSKRISKITQARIITYGLGEGADLRALDLNISMEGLRFPLVFQGTPLPISSSLVGRHNAYNILAAAGTAYCLSLPSHAIVEGVRRMEKVPGRFEKIEAGQDFTVVVDYAHTGDALERVLRTARDLCQGRLITVFGCGGDRDRGKRPVMGEIAARLSDYSIITSDNPRGEDPEKIIADIEAGVKRVCRESKRYVKILDRSRAIHEAIEMARSRDLVVIAGKGHETYQIIGDEAIPFDDRAVAREALAQLGYKRVND